MIYDLRIVDVVVLLWPAGWLCLLFHTIMSCFSLFAAQSHVRTLPWRSCTYHSRAHNPAGLLPRSTRTLLQQHLVMMMQANVIRTYARGYAVVRLRLSRVHHRGGDTSCLGDCGWLRLAAASPSPTYVRESRRCVCC
jgi:hypothetical protein